MTKNETKQLIILIPKEKHKTFKNIVNDQDKFMQGVIEGLIDGYIENHETTIAKLKKSLKHKKK